jgi:hypothetical protein
MTSRGVRCQSEQYNHSVRSHWKIVSDASCGDELVSPPMAGEDGFSQVRRTCEALQAAGVTVNRRCGLHVHHEVTDLTPEQIARVVEFWTEAQDLIDSVLPPSRRQGACYYAERWSQHDVERVKEAARRPGVTTRDLAYQQRGRYKTVNLESLIRQPTIEIRQHSATIEADKIINWIKLGQAVIRAAKAGAPLTSTDLDSWTEALGLDEESREYFRQRRARFERRAANARGPVSAPAH